MTKVSKDDSIGKIPGETPIPSVEPQKEDSGKVDSGLSSIEKSKRVAPELTPPMDAPVLSAPSNQESVAFIVASIDASGWPVKETVRSFILKGEEIKNSVLEAWGENLRAIEEYVRQLLSSPIYIQLQEIRRKGDPLSGTVSGIQGAASANAEARAEPVGFLSTLDHLRSIERVPSTAEVSETTPPKDSSQVLVLPLTAALLIGGGLTLGSAVQASNPLGGVFELVGRLQPLFPTVSVQDLIPLINLMVVGPIYYHSWNEAVSNLRTGGRNSYVQTAQNFAKDAIKIVADPNFVNSTLISRMGGTEGLSPEEQERLSHMLKIVLIGVALSLLYSVEVGKVQNGKFGGIEPEELRELLLGNWKQDAAQKLSLQGELNLSLMNRAQEQLAFLSAEDRMKAANMLLDYITQPRELDPMLDPAKVFEETLASSTFKPMNKSNLFKA